MNAIRLFSFLMFCAAYSHAQVVIGSGNVDSTAILKLDPTGKDKGFLPTRLTENERNRISSPANGLLIYNTDKDCYQYYSRDHWTGCIREAVDPAEETAIIVEFYRGGNGMNFNEKGETRIWKNLYKNTGNFGANGTVKTRNVELIRVNYRDTSDSYIRSLLEKATLLYFPGSSTGGNNLNPGNDGQKFYSILDHIKEGKTVAYFEGEDLSSGQQTLLGYLGYYFEGDKIGTNYYQVSTRDKDKTPIVGSFGDLGGRFLKADIEVSRVRYSSSRAEDIIEIVGVPNFKNSGWASTMVYDTKYNIIVDRDWGHFHNRNLTDTSTCIDYNNEKNNNNIFLCNLLEFAINNKK